jgi:hypothetical protein
VAICRASPDRQSILEMHDRCVPGIASCKRLSRSQTAKGAEFHDLMPGIADAITTSHEKPTGCHPVSSAPPPKDGRRPHRATSHLEGPTASGGDGSSGGPASGAESPQASHGVRVLSWSPWPFLRSTGLDTLFDDDPDVLARAFEPSECDGEGTRVIAARIVLSGRERTSPSSMSSNLNQPVAAAHH